MRGRAWLWLSAAFLLIYAAYVLVAKFGKLIAVKLPFELGNIGEFWLFSAFIGAFCMQIIRDERARPAASADVPHSAAPPYSSAPDAPTQKGSVP
jgi:uncharacterized membrane protein (DUF485 family)